MNATIGRSIAFVVALALLPAIAAGRGPDRELIGQVVSVADGDTLTVRDSSGEKHRVRLDGIDAPEKGQAYGEESRAKLAELAELADHANVKVIWHEHDRYGRIVGEVYAGKIWVNQSMVAAGAAWHWPKYSKSKDLAADPAAAKSERRGLWSSEAVAPWDYRKRDRNR